MDPLNQFYFPRLNQPTLTLSTRTPTQASPQIIILQIEAHSDSFSKEQSNSHLLMSYWRAMTCSRPKTLSSIYSQWGMD